MSTKQLWLLAGGNGAGKSTFYRLFLEPLELRFVNADLIAQHLDKNQPEALSYEAAAIAATLRTSLLQQDCSFCFETVFSHPSKIDFVAEAKALGYETILVYIHLEGVELNQARVAQRVLEGGHNVPANKISSRIPKTMKNIHQALPLFDIAKFYDNSLYVKPYRCVAEIQYGQFKPLVEVVPGWVDEIVNNRTES